jgi:hypothetical protein
MAAGICYKHWKFGENTYQCQQPCNWAGTPPPPRGQLNAVAPGQLLHVIDVLTNRRFLVDTGAAYSIFPHTSSNRPCGPALQGPGGQTIQCWGEREMQLQLGSRFFQWTFLLAAVDFAILGADFLKHHKLAVDLHSG